MKILRTDDERFQSLPGFDFAPHYAEASFGLDTLRVHFLDEGSGERGTVLLMHGEPSWSYLYRKMIPVLVRAGLRCIAPDLVGFGRSDKPARIDDYSYDRHVSSMRSVLIEALDLHNVTLVCQDWGGLIGLRLVAESPERFFGVVAANTGLPTGNEPMTDAFMAWRDYARTTPELPVGAIVAGGCALRPSAEVIAAYDAPFPDPSYKAGARSFPALVPVFPDDPASQDNLRAWESLERFEKPFLTAFSDGDPITRGGYRVFQRRIPGAAGQSHTTIAGAGHFLQEDKGEELAGVVIKFIDENS